LSNREATKVLGVDKRNIKKGYEKCVTDDDGMKLRKTRRCRQLQKTKDDKLLGG
jgi:hypothetical protein